MKAEAERLDCGTGVRVTRRRSVVASALACLAVWSMSLTVVGGYAARPHWYNFRNIHSRPSNRSETELWDKGILSLETLPAIVVPAGLVMMVAATVVAGTAVADKWLWVKVIGAWVLFLGLVLMSILQFIGFWMEFE
jgi:hypothetical protein